MKETISSQLTFFNKFIGPTGIALFGCYTLLNSYKIWAAKSTGTIVFAVLTFVALAAFVYWFCIRTKKVRVTDDFLFVSNYLKEIKIPLADVEEITEIVWLRGQPITVRFAKPTDFGRTIMFIPPVNWLSWSVSPIVTKLEGMVRASKRRS